MKGRMQRNLLFLFLGASALPLPLVTGIGYFTSERAIVSMLQRRTTLSCREVTERFAGRFHRLQDELLLIARGHGVLPPEWPSRGRSEDGGMKYYVEDLIAPGGPGRSFTSVILLDVGGEPRYRVDYQAGLSVRAGKSSHLLQQTGFLDEDRRGAGMVPTLSSTETGFLIPDAGSGTMKIRLVAPLGSDREPVGGLMADFDASPMLESIVAAMGLGSDEYFFLVDSRSGVLLHHPDYAKRNQLLQIAVPDLGDVAFDVAGGWLRFADGDGREWVGSHCRLPDTPWSCAVATPLTPVLAPIRKVGWLSLGLVTVVLGSTSAVVFLGTRRFRTAMQSLTGAAEDFSAGHLQKRVEVRSNDEMGALASTFNRMASQLQEEIRRREEHARFESFHHLSAALAHDLKSSIFSLSLLTENLERHGEDPEFLHDCAATIRQTLAKMRRTAGKLLDRKGPAEMRREPRPLAPLVSEALKESGVAEKPDIRVKTDLDQTVRAIVDAGEIHRLLLNLLHNAAEAMAGGGALALAVRKSVDGQGRTWALVEVSDSGVGMDPGFVRERLFRPFSTTKKRGLGLGLHDSREIAGRHQGTIDVESRPGHGSTFTLRLPAVSAAS